MRIINKIYTFLILFLMAMINIPTYAANQTHDIRTAVSQMQMDAIAFKYVAKLPLDNVQISSVNYTGSYVLNDKNYLMTVHLNQIKFTAIATSDSGDSMEVAIQARVSASIPNLDCSKSAVTVADLQIAHPLFNLVPQRDQLIKYANVFIRDYIISQTNLVNYCAIKPKLFFDHQETI